MRGKFEGYYGDRHREGDFDMSFGSFTPNQLTTFKLNGIPVKNVVGFHVTSLLHLELKCP